MRSPLLVMGVSFSILAIAAGCGGGGGTSTPSTAAPTTSASASTSPSPSGSPSSSSSPSTSPSSSSSPAAVTWTFGGSTDSVTFTQGQVAVPASLAAYGSKNITVTATFVASTSGGGKVNFSDALNNGDVTPNTLPADNATQNYTPIIYISIVNAGSQDIGFGTSVPTIQLGDTSLTSYTTCELDVYGSQGNGTTSSWFTVPNTGTPNGSGVTVGGGTLTGGNTVDFKAGNQQIVAVSCH